jgi:hypothetical protein
MAKTRDNLHVYQLKSNKTKTRNSIKIKIKSNTTIP